MNVHQRHGQISVVVFIAFDGRCKGWVQNQRTAVGLTLLHILKPVAHSITLCAPPPQSLLSYLQQRRPATYGTANQAERKKQFNHARLAALASKMKGQKLNWWFRS